MKKSVQKHNVFSIALNVVNTSSLSQLLSGVQPKIQLYFGWKPRIYLQGMIKIKPIFS